MRSFFIRLTYFFFVLVVLSLLFTLLYYISYKKKVKSDLKEISNFEYLIMGDSQLQRLKPDLFDERTYNFASSGEHFYFTHQKLKELVSIKDNKIKKVVMGISLSSYGPAYNRLFELDFSEGRRSLEKYLYFIDLTDGEFLKVEDLLKKNVFKSLLEGIYNKPDWGGLFVSHEKNPDPTVINKILNIHFGVKKNENVISSEQVKYLNKIQELCSTNNIDLYLVSGPLDPLYKQKTNKLYYCILKNSISSLNDIQYLNFLNDDISPYLLSDAVHLNSAGADIYTRKINDSIK